MAFVTAQDVSTLATVDGVVAAFAAHDVSTLAAVEEVSVWAAA